MRVDLGDRCGKGSLRAPDGLRRFIVSLVSFDGMYRSPPPGMSREPTCRLWRCFRQALHDYGELDRRQCHNRKPPSSKVLLVLERLVSGKENVDPILFRCPQQLAVFQTGPTSVGGSNNLVRPQQPPQSVVEVFVQQHFHGVVCARWVWANSIRRLICSTVRVGKPSRSSSIVSPSS